MKRTRGARFRGAACLGVLLLAAETAPWLAPRPPDLQEDVAGARFLPPLTRAHAIRTDRVHLRIVTSLRATAAGWEFARAGRWESVNKEDLLEPPSSRFYFLGTDQLGRDLASRLFFGARHSVGIAALSMALALGLGVAVGGVAGLAGRGLGGALMWSVDVIRSIPRLLIYLLCASLFPPSTILLVLVLGLTTWTSLARIVRAQMLSLREGSLAVASRALGASPLRTFFRHLAPQIGPLLLVSASLRFADTILLESALSLLGLGSPAPAVSLGGVLASGRDSLAEAWWIALFPGLLLTSVVMSLRSGAASLARVSDPPSLA